MRIMVTGHAGMLGTEVTRAIDEESEHESVPLTRVSMDIGDERRVCSALEGFVPDAVINCAGLTPQRPGVTAREMIWSNAYGSRVLADECDRRKIRLVHVSTDCVFSGTELGGRRMIHGRAYLESDEPDPTDLYGWTKTAGEVTTGLNVRCSFVWPTGGLLNWLLSQPGGPDASVDGWLGALWSGLTARAYARILVRLAEQDITGVLHVPGEALSKHRLLTDVSREFGLGIEVDEVVGPWINRALGSTRWLQETAIEVPRWKEMLKEMTEFYNA